MKEALGVLRLKLNIGINLQVEILFFVLKIKKITKNISEIWLFKHKKIGYIKFKKILKIKQYLKILCMEYYIILVLNTYYIR